MAFVAIQNNAAEGAVSSARKQTGSAAAVVTGVDCHAHIFQRGYRLISDRRYAPDYDAPVDQYLGWLDRHGLSHGVLVQPSFYGTDNGCLIEGLARAPFRLRGIAVLDPDTPEHELWTLDALGVRGVRLNLVGKEIPRLDSEPWPRFLRLLAEMGWHIEVQRHAADIERVVPLLVRQGVDVVVDHFGLPDRQAGIADPGFRALLRLGRSRRVWAKLSAAYRIGSREVALQAYAPLREAMGLERLLWGSDWPHTRFEGSETYQANRAFFDMLVPDAEERAVILARNPSALFRFD